MNILIDINHPAHVHLFKHFAWIMQDKGHKLLFTTRKKEISHILLENLGFEYECFGKHYKSMRGKLWGIAKFDAMLLNTSRKFKPDLFLSMGSIYASHASAVLRKPNILLQDTEHAKMQYMLSMPFCDVMLNPACFRKKFSDKQIFYPGYHELAYLHPNHFEPDPTILDELGLENGEPFVIMRFVSWNANHDLGHSGLTLENKIRAAEEFSKYAKVYITSEDPLPERLDQYRIKIKPERIHHAMHYASLLYGESATMASECAMMGTPSIFLDNDGRGYTDEQEKEYGLVFNYSESAEDQTRSIDKGIELLSNPGTHEAWQSKRNQLLSEKIDVSNFLVWFVENYPQSKDELLDQPEEVYARFINSPVSQPHNPVS